MLNSLSDSTDDSHQLAATNTFKGVSSDSKIPAQQTMHNHMYIGSTTDPMLTTATTMMGHHNHQTTSYGFNL